MAGDCAGLLERPGELKGDDMAERVTPGLDRWMAAYEPALAKAAAAGKYPWPAADAPVVAGKMRAAIERGSYHHEGPAMHAACKALGIKYTRTAIEAFLKGA